MIVKLDSTELKDYINKTGMKQKAVSEKSGISESTLCFILQGKRRCEAGEYASICNALSVPMNRFLKPKLPDMKGEGINPMDFADSPEEKAT